ncbi:MAG: DUF4166 domain-containing protein [Shimia sp.]
MEPLFPRLLGPAFAALPGPVRDSHVWHETHVLAGEARIVRGAGAWPRLIAALFGFPPAAEAMPVRVVKRREGAAEIWERTFGAHRFRSRLRIEGGRMVERFTPFDFTLDLHVEGGALHFPVAAGRLGPLPMPARLLPVSDARETARDGALVFDVRLLAPVTRQLIVHYRGTLRPA